MRYRRISMKRLAYQRCEQSGCRREGTVMVRDKNDYFIAVCKECSAKRKVPVGAHQGKLM